MNKRIEGSSLLSSVSEVLLTQLAPQLAGSQLRAFFMRQLNEKLDSVDSADRESVRTFLSDTTNGVQDILLRVVACNQELIEIDRVVTEMERGTKRKVAEIIEKIDSLQRNIHAAETEIESEGMGNRKKKNLRTKSDEYLAELVDSWEELRKTDVLVAQKRQEIDEILIMREEILTSDGSEIVVQHSEEMVSTIGMAIENVVSGLKKVRKKAPKQEEKLSPREESDRFVARTDNFIERKGVTYSAVRKNLEKAIESDPDNAKAWARFADLYYCQKKYEKAEEAIRKALELEPDNSLHHSGLAIALQKSEAEGSFEESELEVQRALELDPENVQAWYVLSIIAREKGDLAETEQALRKTIALEPLDPRYNEDLWGFLDDQGRHDEAVEEISRFALRAELPVASKGLLGTLLEALVRQGKIDEARIEHKRALEDLGILEVELPFPDEEIWGVPGVERLRK